MTQVKEMYFKVAEVSNYDHETILNCSDSQKIIYIFDNIRYKMLALININALMNAYVETPMYGEKINENEYDFSVHETRDFVVTDEMIRSVFWEYDQMCNLDEYICKHYPKILCTEISENDIYEVLSRLIMFNVNKTTKDLSLFISNNYNSINGRMFNGILGLVERIISRPSDTDEFDKYDNLVKRYNDAYNEWVKNINNCSRMTIKLTRRLEILRN